MIFSDYIQPTEFSCLYHFLDETGRSTKNNDSLKQDKQIIQYNHNLNPQAELKFRIAGIVF